MSVAGGKRAESAESGAAFSASAIPRVQVENIEDFSKVWQVPTSTSDFDLTWVTFVMQQYYKIEDKPSIVRKFTVEMAGNQEDQQKEKCERG